uniref:NADH dehydrogenase subunit 6 n=1 Tax=Polymyxa betae TaxID=41456 RepID=UPI001D12DCE7|nr:NADH dehydrogenase subunit 6 [Polymyxa betae]CAG9644864.1 NADH dehydrogenase subunit 6 [Polymyxa betae]
MVIISNNPVYSALFLILVFFNSGLLILLLDLEFLALIFILIYIGAIMVLVLFVIMMLDIKQTTLYINTFYYFFMSGFFLIILGSEFLYFISADLTFFQQNHFYNYLNWFSLVLESSNIKNLGHYLYTYFSAYFLIAGLILLVAMLGAISLTLEDSAISVGTKHQQLFKQLSVDPRNSIFYLK